MVRGRLHSHLKSLKEQFSDLLGDCEVQETVGTDYAFRLFVQKSAWVKVLEGLAEETDYDNFKSEVAHHQGKAGAAYEHSLHEVWSVMNRLQSRKQKVEEAPILSQDDENILDRIWDNTGEAKD